MPLVFIYTPLQTLEHLWFSIFKGYRNGIKWVKICSFEGKSLRTVSLYNQVK